MGLHLLQRKVTSTLGSPWIGNPRSFFSVGPARVPNGEDLRLRRERLLALLVGRRCACSTRVRSSWLCHGVRFLCPSGQVLGASGIVACGAYRELPWAVWSPPLHPLLRSHHAVSLVLG